MSFAGEVITQKQIAGVEPPGFSVACNHLSLSR
jgi:hypothetical protein